MGFKNSGRGTKSWHRKTFTVDAVSGDYATETIVFGAPGSGEAEQSFAGITALLEGPMPLNARAELWLPRIADGGKQASAFTVTDYFFAGQVLQPTGTSGTATGETWSFGSATWPLAGYTGAMIRVKGGGVPGTITISATGF